MMMQPGGKERWGKGAGKQEADLEFGAGMAEFRGRHGITRQEKKRKRRRGESLSSCGCLCLREAVSLKKANFREDKPPDSQSRLHGQVGDLCRRSEGVLHLV